MKHNVSEISLANGSKGLLIDIPDAQVMNIEISFRAGDYLVETKKWEIPHLMEHILLGANELYPRSRLFQAELEKNGAYANASTGSYDITYEAECADFEWDRILGLMIVAITKPLFLEEEFLAEYGNVKEELYSRSNNHFRTLNLTLRKKYGFYSLPDDERLQLMENVQLSDIQAHYKRTHTAPNMRFVIAGNLSVGRIEMIEKMISSIDLSSEGRRIALPNEIPQSILRPVYIERSVVENIYFYIDTFVRRRMLESEIYSLVIANIILTETLYSRIYGQAREKGLIYGISSGYSRFQDSTNYWLGAQVLPKNIHKLFSIINNEINELRQGKISNNEIKAAKLCALGRYMRSAQTVASTASIYSNRYFYNEEIEEYDLAPERIQAVTKKQVENSLNAVFNDKIKGFGVLGSCGQEFVDKLYEQLRGLW